MPEPRPYNRRMRGDWFLQRRNYVKFMIRELTSVFIAAYVIVLLVMIASLDNATEFESLLSTLAHPGWILFHVVALAAALFHAFTWFNLTPKAMPVFIGEKRAPGWAVAVGMGYAPWVVLTIIILWATCP